MSLVTRVMGSNYPDSLENTPRAGYKNQRITSESLNGAYLHNITSKQSEFHDINDYRYVRTSVNIHDALQPVSLKALGIHENFSPSPSHGPAFNGHMSSKAAGLLSAGDCSVPPLNLTDSLIADDPEPVTHEGDLDSLEDDSDDNETVRMAVISKWKPVLSESPSHTAVPKLFEHNSITDSISSIRSENYYLEKVLVAKTPVMKLAKPTAELANGQDVSSCKRMQKQTLNSAHPGEDHYAVQEIMVEANQTSVAAQGIPQDPLKNTHLNEKQVRVVPAKPRLETKNFIEKNKGKIQGERSAKVGYGDRLKKKRIEAERISEWAPGMVIPKRLAAPKDEPSSQPSSVDDRTINKEYDSSCTDVKHFAKEIISLPEFPGGEQSSLMSPDGHYSQNISKTISAEQDTRPEEAFELYQSHNAMPIVEGYGHQGAAIGPILQNRAEAVSLHSYHYHPNIYGNQAEMYDNRDQHIGPVETYQIATGPVMPSHYSSGIYRKEMATGPVSQTKESYVQLHDRSKAPGPISQEVMRIGPVETPYRHYQRQPLHSGYPNNDAENNFSHSIQAHSRWSMKKNAEEHSLPQLTEETGHRDPQSNVRYVASQKIHQSNHSDVYMYQEDDIESSSPPPPDWAKTLSTANRAINPYAAVPPIQEPSGQTRVVATKTVTVHDAPARATHEETTTGYYQAFLMQKEKASENNPSYKAYTIKDYKKLNLDIQLRGLGPSADPDTLKEKNEKRLRQLEYAKKAMKTEKQKKPIAKPITPNRDLPSQTSARKAAVEYAKTIPKPKIAPPSIPEALPAYNGASLYHSQSAPTVRSQSQPSLAVPQSLPMSAAIGTFSGSVERLQELWLRHNAEKEAVEQIRYKLQRAV